MILGVVLWCCLAIENESPATHGTQCHQDERSCHLWLNVIRCLGARLASVLDHCANHDDDGDHNTGRVLLRSLEQLLKENDVLTSTIT